MLYLMEAIDNHDDRYELWAKGEQDALTRLQAEHPDRHFKVFLAGEMPHHLTYWMINYLTEQSPVLEHLLPTIDEKVGDFMRKFEDSVQRN